MYDVGALEFNQIGIRFVLIYQKIITAQTGPNNSPVNLIVGDKTPVRIDRPVLPPLLGTDNNSLLLLAKGLVSIQRHRYSPLASVSISNSLSYSSLIHERYHRSKNYRSAAVQGPYNCLHGRLTQNGRRNPQCRAIWNGEQ